jgi:hypothetical protein
MIARSYRRNWREASMKIHRTVAAAFGIAALSVTLAAPAGADPRKGEVVELNCDNLGTLEIVVFSNAQASPGLVLDSNQVLVPYQLRIEGTFTPIGGEPETFVEEFEKPAPQNGRLDHCTFHQEGTDEFGSFELDGEVGISYTPGA